MKAAASQRVRARSRPRSAAQLMVSEGGVEARPEFRTFVEQRLLGTLGRLRRHVDCFTVRGETVDMRPLQDAFRCHIVASLVGGRELVEDEVAGDLYVATDRAARRLTQDLEHAVARQSGNDPWR